MRAAGGGRSYPTPAPVEICILELFAKYPYDMDCVAGCVWCHDGHQRDELCAQQPGEGNLVSGKSRACLLARPAPTTPPLYTRSTLANLGVFQWERKSVPEQIFQSSLFGTYGHDLFVEQSVDWRRFSIF